MFSIISVVFLSILSTSAFTNTEYCDATYQWCIINDTQCLDVETENFSVTACIDDTISWCDDYDCYSHIDQNVNLVVDFTSDPMNSCEVAKSKDTVGFHCCKAVSEDQQFCCGVWRKMSGGGQSKMIADCITTGCGSTVSGVPCGQGYWPD